MTTDYAARAEKLLRAAPSAGSVNQGQVEALTGIGWALLALLDSQQTAPSKEDTDRG